MTDTGPDRVEPRLPGGFPEWLPSQRLAEIALVEGLRSQFELYGFTPIETPAVELPEVLAAKGWPDHQVYGLVRPNGSNSQDVPSVWLHWDLTIPFARYCAEHYNELVFPFRRYQIQKVWRGERPQQGRYREFYQCDVDVVGDGALSLQADAEMLAVATTSLAKLDIGSTSTSVSNLKILAGLLDHHGLSAGHCRDIYAEIRRFRKTGSHGLLLDRLTAEAEVDRSIAVDLIDVLSCANISDLQALAGKSWMNAISEEGVREITVVFSLANGTYDIDEQLTLDLSLTRGLDYYTSTVMETVLTDRPGVGAICAGGRYDNLVHGFIDRAMPGVGISFGLSRLFAELLRSGVVRDRVSTVSELYVAQTSADTERSLTRLAQHLRNSGIRTEVHPGIGQLASQWRLADRKGIPLGLHASAMDLDSDSVRLRNLQRRTDAVVRCDGLADLVKKELYLLQHQRLWP